MRVILLLLIAFNAGESLFAEVQWWQFRGPMATVIFRHQIFH